MNNTQRKTRARSEVNRNKRSPEQTANEKIQPQRYTLHRLHVLRTLPFALYGEVVRRFAYGETAKDVAYLIYAQEDRGGCQALSLESLRQYLQVLRKKVRETDGEKGPSRLATIHSMAKELQKEEIRLSNVVEDRRAGGATKECTPAPLDANKVVREVKPAPSDANMVREIKQIEEELKNMVATLSARQVAAFNYQLAKLRMGPVWDLEIELKVPLNALTRIQNVQLRCVNALLECDRIDFHILRRRKMQMKEFETEGT